MRLALSVASAIPRPILLLSALGAAGTVGPGWFQAVIRKGKTEFPDVMVKAMLDCGDSPGHALAALRQGVDYIRFDGIGADKVADIALQTDSKLIRTRPESLDFYHLELTGQKIDTACRTWLLDAN